MALVKFGQLTLNVENVPDGHMIVSEAEFNTMKQASNALFSLKSKIPVGIDESQLGVLIEKGQRHDTIAQELINTQKSVTGLTEKVNKFSNIPEGFSAEQWNKDRNTEKMNARASKLAVLEKQVFDKVEQQHKVRPQVDKRFVTGLDEIDLDAKNAFDLVYEAYDKGHTAQQEFVKNMSQTKPGSETVGGGQKITVDGVDVKITNSIEPRHI
jgi:hypothetical protein